MQETYFIAMLVDDIIDTKFARTLTNFIFNASRAFIQKGQIVKNRLLMLENLLKQNFLIDIVTTL
jgi:hypothetical protein